jgi:DME family drug/metabolite transporter
MQVAANARSSRSLALGVLFGFGAALSYGGSQVLTRHSVSELAPPLLGSAIALFWGTLGFSLISARGLFAPSLNYRRGAILFAVAGVLSAIGVIGLFKALALGQVVVVAPVVSTNPLFTLLFAVLLLREVEKVSPQVIAGSLLVVAGVIVLTAG